MLSNMRMRDLAEDLAVTLGEHDCLSYNVINNAEKIISGMKELQSPAVKFKTENRVGEVVEIVF